MVGIPHSLKTAINGALGLAGFRLVRNDPPPPPPSPDDAGLRQILTHLAISVVFDVGAHTGQYATRLRNIGYRGRIVSFEPQAAPFAVLSGKASRDPQWQAVRLALGDREAEQDLNISQNSWSSSFLPVSTEILQVETGIATVATETVSVKTLDQVGQELIQPSDSLYLKIDAQGFEPKILAGAHSLLSRCRAVQMEMALFPSYQGQTLLPEMLRLMSENGFRLAHLERGFWNPSTGCLMEVDGVFVRTKEESTIGR